MLARAYLRNAEEQQQEKEARRQQQRRQQQQTSHRHRRSRRQHDHRRDEDDDNNNNNGDRPLIDPNTPKTAGKRDSRSNAPPTAVSFAAANTGMAQAAANTLGWGGSSNNSSSKGAVSKIRAASSYAPTPLQPTMMSGSRGEKKKKVRGRVKETVLQMEETTASTFNAGSLMMTSTPVVPNYRPGSNNNVLDNDDDDDGGNHRAHSDRYQHQRQNDAAPAVSLAGSDTTSYSRAARDLIMRSIGSSCNNSSSSAAYGMGRVRGGEHVRLEEEMRMRMEAAAVMEEGGAVGGGDNTKAGDDDDEGAPAGVTGVGGGGGGGGEASSPEEGDTTLMRSGCYYTPGG